jgi:sterol desaturase/sphingolipid hydroxylase (fatty acid hydroxylase superfamily)
MPHLTEYTCCSSVAFERPNENTCTSPALLLSLIPTNTALALPSLSPHTPTHSTTAHVRMDHQVSNLSLGVVSQALGPIVGLVVTDFPYGYIHRHWRIASLPPDSLWAWWLVFLLKDLGYYWSHRLMHEVSLGWAEHVVHHSGVCLGLLHVPTPCAQAAQRCPLSGPLLMCKRPPTVHSDQWQ